MFRSFRIDVDCLFGDELKVHYCVYVILPPQKCIVTKIAIGKYLFIITQTQKSNSAVMRYAADTVNFPLFISQCLCKRKQKQQQKPLARRDHETSSVD